MAIKTKGEVLAAIEKAFHYYFRYHGVLFIGTPAEKELGEYREYVIKILARLKLTNKVYLWELFNPFKYGLEDFSLQHWEIWANILEQLKKEKDFPQAAHANFDQVITLIKQLFVFEKVDFIFDAKNKIYRITNEKFSIFNP